MNKNTTLLLVLILIVSVITLYVLIDHTNADVHLQESKGYTAHGIEFD